MAFGDGQGRPVIVPNQPLVTSAEDAVNPAAVQNLVDSFRQGSITAQDIYDRIGPVGQAKKKAALEQLSEYVDPAAIEARKAEIAAGGAQAQLASEQAQAGRTLLPGQTELAAAQAKRAQADLVQKQAIDAYTSINPPIFKKDSHGNETKEPDYQAMAREGIHYVRASSMLQLATEGLAGTWMKETDPKTNQQTLVFRNKSGEDVSPAGNNPYVKFYRKMKQDALTLLHREPDTEPAATPLATPSPNTPPPPAPSIVEPIGGSAQGNAMRAAAANAGMKPADAAQLPISAFVQPNTAAPAPPAAAPTINPDDYVPGTGISQGVPTGHYKIPSEIADELHKQKAYEAWDTQKGFANTFDTAAKRILNTSEADQRSGKEKMNQRDMSLAESSIKLFDPQGTIREFKWDKLAENQPLFELMKNAKAEILRTGTFTPETRKRIIEAGYDNINGKESAVRSQLQLADTRASKAGLDRDIIFNPDEKRVLAGQNLGGSSAPGSAPSAAPPGGKRANYKGAPGWVTPDGFFHPDS